MNEREKQSGASSREFVGLKAIRGEDEGRNQERDAEKVVDAVEKNDSKITISRSYSRKVNLGNYEVADYFASYSIEYPVNTRVVTDDARLVSSELYAAARLDVENSIVRSIDANRPLLEKLIEQARKGEPIELSEYIEVVESPYASFLINEAKKEWKRSEEYKASRVPRTNNK